eukprot:4727669-Alexandrium_andersonii.AAC.1
MLLFSSSSGFVDLPGASASHLPREPPILSYKRKREGESGGDVGAQTSKSGFKPTPKRGPQLFFSTNCPNFVAI